MFCEKCGTKCKEGAKFCSACGAPVESDAPTNDSPLSASESEDTVTPSGSGWFQHHKKIAWIILIVIIAVVIVIVVMSVARHSSKDADMSVEEQLALGARYYKEGSYEEAVAELTAVLDVEQNMQAYRYLADSYLDLSHTENADENYVALAGEVYEDAVKFALNTYEQTGELPEYTEEIYGDARDYEDEYDKKIADLDDKLGNLIEEDTRSDSYIPSDEETEAANWEILYRDYIIGLSEMDSNDPSPYNPTYSYSLIYIDDDDVPELLVNTHTEDATHSLSGNHYSLFSVKENELEENELSLDDTDSYFSYVPYGGQFQLTTVNYEELSFASGNEEVWCVYDYVYSINEDGAFEEMCRSYLPTSEEVYEGADTESYLHYRDNNSEYMYDLSGFYDVLNAVEPSMVSEEEILDQLENFSNEDIAIGTDDSATGQEEQEAQEKLDESAEDEAIESEEIDMEAEIEHIRDIYYNEIQPNYEASYTKTDVRDGVVDYVSPSGQYKKRVISSGTDGNDWAREYYYENGKLLFAFYFHESEENRFYFHDGSMIRWIDEDGTVYDLDYDNALWDSWESEVISGSNE